MSNDIQGRDEQSFSHRWSISLSKAGQYLVKKRRRDGGREGENREDIKSHIPLSLSLKRRERPIN